MEPLVWMHAVRVRHVAKTEERRSARVDNDKDRDNADRSAYA